MYNTKSFFIGLLASSIIGIILISWYGSLFSTETDFIGYLLIFFVLWTPERLFYHVIIYSVNFAIAHLLYKKVRSKALFFLLYYIFTTILGAISTYIDWTIFKRKYVNFEDYWHTGNYIPIYFFTVILVVSFIMLLKVLGRWSVNYKPPVIKIVKD